MEKKNGRWTNDIVSMCLCVVEICYLSAGSVVINCILNFHFSSSTATLIYFHLLEDVLRRAMQEEPTHGLNWSPATKNLFSKSVAKGGRKNFAAVSKRIKKKAGDCQVRMKNSY